MPNYKVADGHRLFVDRMYEAGDTVELTREQAEPLLETGSVAAARGAAAHKPEAKAEDKSEG